MDIPQLNLLWIESPVPEEHNYNVAEILCISPPYLFYKSVEISKKRKARFGVLFVDRDDQ